MGGGLKQVESGPNGVVWGINKAGYIYLRAGVSKKNPLGTSWISVVGLLSHVTVGCTGVYGVNSKQEIWRYHGMPFCSY